jgi:hypothetical protein
MEGLLSFDVIPGDGFGRRESAQVRVDNIKLSHYVIDKGIAQSQVVAKRLKSLA